MKGIQDNGAAGLMSELALPFPEFESVLMTEGVREPDSVGLASAMESTAFRMNLKSSCFDVNCLRSRSMRLSTMLSRDHPGLRIALLTQSLCRPVMIAVNVWKLLNW